MVEQFKTKAVMRIMKSSKALLILALIALSLSACDLLEQEPRVYDGPPKIGFYPLTETVDEGIDTVTTEIQLIAPQRDSDLQVNFTVDDSSSAVEGTHYHLGSTTTTIPEGKSVTELSIEVLDNNVDDGDTNYELFLTLQTSEGIEPAVNLKTYTLTIRGMDEEAP